jgi:hypothetical protein
MVTASLPCKLAAGTQQDDRAFRFVQFATMRD